MAYFEPSEEVIAGHTADQSLIGGLVENQRGIVFNVYGSGIAIGTAAENAQGACNF